MYNLLSLFQGYVEKKSFMLFGKFEIAFYGLCIAGAMVICCLVAIPVVKRKGLNPDLLLDIMIAVVPCSIICARAWYVILDLDQFIDFDNFNFWKTVWSICNIKSGGIAIQGGVLGGALGLAIVSKIKKIEFGKLADIGATLLPLGQAIGRWGNFFNQEVYGKVTDITTFPISVYIQKLGEYHYALFFYEMVLNLILFGLLMAFVYGYNGKRNCYSMSFYLMGYGLIRSVLEPLRDLEFQMGNLNLPIPASTLTSIGFIIAGAIVFGITLYRDIKDKNYWWKYMFKKNVSLSAESKTNSEACNDGNTTVSE